MTTVPENPTHTYLQRLSQLAQLRQLRYHVFCHHVLRAKQIPSNNTNMATRTPPLFYTPHTQASNVAAVHASQSPRTAATRKRFRRAR